MGIVITGELLAQKKVRLSHAPSGAQIQTAAPLDNNGDGSTFSPTDLCAASLGSCMLTTMAIYAEKSDIKIAFANVRVEKIMQAAPRRIGSLQVEIELPKELSEAERNTLETAAVNCPVAKSLGPEVETPVSFAYK